jgi:hypothetical protein
MLAVQKACRGDGFPCPGDSAEVPRFPEGKIGVRPAAQQSRKGLDPTHRDAGPFMDHFAYEARAELSTGMKIEAGIVKSTEAASRGAPKLVTMFVRQR